jgi:hypothetical protein
LDSLDGTIARAVVANDDSNVGIVEAVNALEAFESVSPAIVVDEQDVHTRKTVH